MTLEVNMLFRQALQQFREGNYALTQITCEKVLAIDKNHVLARGLLGQLCSFKSEFSKAAAYYAKCLAIDPGNRDIRTLLAELHTSTGDFHKAIREYDRILRKHPSFAPVVAGRAEALRRQGSTDEAMASLRPLIERGEEDVTIATVYARIAVQFKEFDHAIEVLQRHQSAPSAESRRMLLTELGRAYELNRDYDRAFASFDECNRVAPASYDAAADWQRVEHIMSVFDAATMDRLPRSTNDDDTPIFIVSMPRSGSTLVEQILAAHPSVYGAGEVLFMNDLASNLGLRIGSIQGYPDCVRDLESEDVDTLGREYLQQLKALAPSARHITDKNLGAIEQVGLIALLLPQAKIIHVKRHPLDTCLSCFVQRFAAHTMPYADNLTHLGQRYGLYCGLMTHWRDTLSIPMLEIEYEQLLADQEGQTRRLLDYCGLPWDETCLRYYQARRKVLTLSREQVNRPLYHSSMHRYRHYEKHLGPLMEALREHDVTWDTDPATQSPPGR